MFFTSCIMLTLKFYKLKIIYAIAVYVKIAYSCILKNAATVQKRIQFSNCWQYDSVKKDRTRVS